VRTFGVDDIAEFASRLAELRSSEAPPKAAGEYVAYTDGACFGNPSGPGGWAAVLLADSQTWKLYGHLSSTSNNRAEALGVLAALEWVPSGSKLRSDSELTIRLLQGRYKIKANTDVWDLILRARDTKQLDLTYEWVRGHAGDTFNELADRLSKAGAANR
jgi:ribonuclease HI